MCSIGLGSLAQQIFKQRGAEAQGAASLTLGTAIAIAVVAMLPRHVRYRNKSGKHMLVASFSYFDRCRRKRVCVTDSTMIPTD